MKKIILEDKLRIESNHKKDENDPNITVTLNVIFGNEIIFLKGVSFLIKIV